MDYEKRCRAFPFIASGFRVSGFGLWLIFATELHGSFFCPEASGWIALERVAQSVSLFLGFRFVTKRCLVNCYYGKTEHRTLDRFMLKNRNRTHPNYHNAL